MLTENESFLLLFITINKSISHTKKTVAIKYMIAFYVNNKLKYS